MLYKIIHEIEMEGGLTYRVSMFPDLAKLDDVKDVTPPISTLLNKFVLSSRAVFKKYLPVN